MLAKIFAEGGALGPSSMPQPKKVPPALKAKIFANEHVGGVQPQQAQAQAQKLPA